MKKNIKLFIVIIVLGIASMWKLIDTQQTKNPRELTTANKSDNKAIKLVSPQEFTELAKDKSAFVIDVHTPEQTHIPNTDAFIADTEIKNSLDKLPTDKAKPILVYCRSGNMSARAAKELVKMGYKNVYDLKGGTNAYKEQQVSVSLWPETISLGTVIYGEVARTEFTLTNYTPLPIKITRVSTSCGCTKAEVEKTELGAYESTSVKVSFDPAVHKDDTDLGDLTRTIYIETDNPNYTDLETTITATVIKK